MKARELRDKLNQMTEAQLEQTVYCANVKGAIHDRRELLVVTDLDNAINLLYTNVSEWR